MQTFFANVCCSSPSQINKKQRDKKHCMMIYNFIFTQNKATLLHRQAHRCHDSAKVKSIPTTTTIKAINSTMTTAKAGEGQAKDRISDGVVNGGGPGAIACQVEDGVNTSTTTATTAAGGAASTNDGTTSPEQDKEESSSTGSDEVKGSGSGGGYSADCSSSDTSSVGHGKSGGSGTGSGNEKEEQSIAQEGRTVPEKEMSSLHLGSSTSMGRAQHKPSGGTMMQEMDDDDDDDDESDDFDDESGDGKPAALPSSLKAQMMNHAEGQSGRLEEQGASNIHAVAALGAFPSSSSSNPARRGASRSVESLTTSRKGSRKAHLPQWNGVRIQHPMDPRIDLSTVGFVNIPSFQQQNHPSGSGFASAASHLQQFAGSETGSSSEQPTVPTVDQYMKLMEVSLQEIGVTQSTLSFETLKMSQKCLHCTLFWYAVGSSFLSCAWPIPRPIQAATKAAAVK